MINFKSVTKFSLPYALLKIYVDFAYLWLFYKRVYILNKNKVPKDKAVIIAPNHQNALMDALAVLASFRNRTVFLARSDIFQNPVVARIMRSFRIMPIYRIRDGIGSLQKNQDTFNMSAEVLKSQQRLSILPEGNHAGFKRLRPLKKGLARIAFQVAEENDFKFDVYIVPVGLEYSHYQNLRSTLIINFGDPIRLSDYNERYKENHPRAFTALTKDLRKHLIKQMTHIESDEYYDSVLELKDMYALEILNKEKKPVNPVSLFIEGKRIVEYLNQFIKESPDKFKAIDQKVKTFTKALRKEKMTHDVFAKKRHSVFELIIKSLLMILSFPAHIFGLINNFIPILVAEKIVTKIKDPQFRSSVKFVILILLYPVLYLAMFFIVWAFEPVWWIKYVYILLSIICGYILIDYASWSRNILAKWRYNFYVNRKKSKISKMKRLRDQIIAEVKSIDNLNYSYRHKRQV